MHVKRSLQVPILSAHDQADTDSSCPVRYTTTVPTQALGMLNGAFTNEAAAAFAARLQREAPDLEGQVRRAIRLTTGRVAGEEEVRKDVAFVRRLKDEAKLTEADKYMTTQLILDMVADMESRGYYPQDLKCSNLLLDIKKRKLHLIDLGAGITRGMYRPEAESNILRGDITGRDMLYTLGRTLWELWDSESFLADLLHTLPVDGSLPSIIERMIKECCSEQVSPTAHVTDFSKIYKILIAEVVKE